MTTRATKCGLPQRYRYNARQFNEFGRWYYYYEVVGEHGAVRLHLSKHDDARGWIGGIETHYLRRPEYMEPQPPHHRCCLLLDQPCWHDGSSLAADAYVVYHEAGEVELIFQKLVEHADDRFDGQSRGEVRALEAVRGDEGDEGVEGVEGVDR